MKANEPTAWTALERTAKRADVETRFSLIASTYPPDDLPPTARKASLTFLAKFLDDSAILDLGPPAEKESGGVVENRKVEVRNRAAEQLARMLCPDIEPKPGWKDADWAKFRDDVRKALAREGIR